MDGFGSGLFAVADPGKGVGEVGSGIGIVAVLAALVRDAPDATSRWTLSKHARRLIYVGGRACSNSTTNRVIRWTPASTTLRPGIGCGCRTYLLVSGERLASRLGQVDDRHDRPIESLWDPALDIAAVRVEPGALEFRVEDTEVGRSVRAAAGHPLPRDRIVGLVRVHESLPEPLLAILPWLEHVLGEQRCSDHANPVMHPACLPQLPHSAVDEVDAGAALSPRSHQAIVRMIGEIDETWTHGGVL